MNILSAFLILLLVHWVADFVLQTHWQATNKSKRLDALSYHVANYTLVLGTVAFVLFGVWGLAFAAVNGALHFATDFCTSRWTSHLYARQDYHNFFVVIGLDQLIHQYTLAITLWLIMLRP